MDSDIYNFSNELGHVALHKGLLFYMVDSYKSHRMLGVLLGTRVRKRFVSKSKATNHYISTKGYLERFGKLIHEGQS